MKDEENNCSFPRTSHPFFIVCFEHFNFFKAKKDVREKKKNTPEKSDIFFFFKNRQKL
jgi:hypothetical protein